ncbi:2-hydroxychromene-2-carboxylate isomerase [Aliikangiella sp. IMCC44359]|uniref:2-hydroxychromene-2-carboxylate isomerase n=1 Tax=Aliikangiella sp. IMCC44359 TaxID=3459125 RepID=UPI00403B2E66
MKKCRFYFHFRSPYSWIGARWLEKLTSLNVEYVPFWELDDLSRDLITKNGGEHSYTPMSKAKHLYILQDIKRITSKLNLKLKWPPSPDNQHWEIPHLAYLYARKEGKGKEFFNKIHEARWEKGEDICNRDVIAKIAEACHLDIEATKNAFENEDIRQDSVVEMMKAYEDGVFGIPFFVHGYNKFWGIDRFELFVKSIQGELPEITSTADSFLPYYETDHPGGCG